MPANNHHRRIIAAARISESLRNKVYNDIRSGLSPADRQKLDYWYSRTAIGAGPRWPRVNK